MKRKVLLVYIGGESEYLVSSRSGELSMKRTPQLGMQYLSAVLKKSGIACDIWDRSVDSFKPYDIARKLEEEPHLCVGFYVDTAMRGAVCNWIRLLRAASPDVPILVGGPGYFSARQYLEAGASVVCCGEGERTILDIIECLEGKRDEESIKGIAFLREGELVKTPPRELIENLDELPFPNRDSVDIFKYHDWRVLHMRKPYATMITSRGCSRRCTFCSVPSVSGGRVRTRSPENVLAEIDYVVDRYGVRYIGFKDDYFAYSYRWTEAFCEGLIKRRYDLLWSCQTHPFAFRKNRKVKLHMLKEAGCDILIFGLQSVDSDILRRIKRSPLEPEVVQENVAVAKRLGIQTIVEFIFGLPGETEATIKRAVAYALKVKPQYAAFYSLLRLEGSEIYEHFGDAERVCGMSGEKVDRWCSWALRRFYLSPGVLVPTAIHVLRNNPRWLIHGVKYLRGMLTRR
jgi:radical SAM superfamily enzyme YgiQ (UPF0313 family)